ncbi:hypothetical protein CJD36_017745 [Flavipsychrobacter stenotrophus]|uniref:DUF4154 domain-containing protein n=2 Tax=Flavipsychrobacter stenotrophus TaxID=2077091 RepID=A0A2S7ST20_9BACT|nr:hypothetical protein CJD36_017745 [Flavipsychrobacter stenotrophus]
MLLTGLVKATPMEDYGVKANIIYRFTKYVDWPPNRKNGDFIIGIVGESPLYEELRLYTSKKNVGLQSIVVKHYTSYSELDYCHILIVTEDESSEVKRIANITIGNPVLIVSENTGLARKGSCINFITANGHLKLEFNKTNIEQRELKIATELLNLGTIVK